MNPDSLLRKHHHQFSAPVEQPSAKDLTLALGGRWDQAKGKGTARCPAHDDKTPSLALEDGDDGKPLWFCHANCSQESVLAAFQKKGIWPDAAHGGRSAGQRSRIVATYDYVDETGNLRLQVVRRAPKTFLQRRPDGKGDWIWNSQGVPHLLYRLPDVIEAIATEQTVFVVEGEKDVDNLASLGLVATCNAGGAGKWRDEHSAFLRGATVCIIPDNDDAGRKHAEAVAQSLSGVAHSVQILELRDLPPKGDVSDWVCGGGTAERLWALVEMNARRADAPSDDGVCVDLVPWPIMNSKANHGIVGRIATLATENSEADPAAVLITAITYAAAEFGRSQYTRIGDSVHNSRHFSVIAGQSSRARKGTSFGPVQRIFKRAEEIRLASSSALPFPSASKLTISHGPLSSGEGLINAVRDGQDVPPGATAEEMADLDRGVADKRLLVIEEEFGSVLRMGERTGSSLSTIIRRMWDGNGSIAPLTKTSQIKTTNPHVCIVGHVTCPELKSLLSGTEIFNGFANRFMWLMARRPRVVPFPEPMPDDQVDEVAKELARVILKAHGQDRELVMSNSAMHHWSLVYPELTADFPGVLGAVTSRQEAHTRRLALTYAQLDGADRIEIEHLEAAIALTRYCFDSASYLFGVVEIDPVAQAIIAALKTGSKSQSEIQRLSGGHIPASRLASALRDLQDRGRITLVVEQTKGRPRRVWSLVE